MVVLLGLTLVPVGCISVRTTGTLTAGDMARIHTVTVVVDDPSAQRTGTPWPVAEDVSKVCKKVIEERGLRVIDDEAFSRAYIDALLRHKPVPAPPPGTDAVVFGRMSGGWMSTRSGGKLFYLTELDVRLSNPASSVAWRAVRLRDPQAAGFTKSHARRACETLFTASSSHAP